MVDVHTQIGDVFFSSPRGVYRMAVSFIGWQRYCYGMFWEFSYWYRAYGVSSNEMQLKIRIKKIK
jgi:hypothetical protein